MIFFRYHQWCRIRSSNSFINKRLKTYITIISWDRLFQTFQNPSLCMYKAYNTQKIWGHRAFFRVMSFRTWPPSEDFDKMTTTMKNFVKSIIPWKQISNTHYFNLNIYHSIFRINKNCRIKSKKYLSLKKR